METGVYCGYGLANFDERPARKNLPAGQSNYQQGDNGKGYERQRNVQIEQVEDHEPQPYEVGEDGEKTTGQQLLHNGDIVLDPGHHSSHLVTIQEAER